MGVVVNIFGGAGVGKSTVSAELFAKLKKKGLEVEYVTEFAKDLVWEKRDETFKDQAYIFGKQYHRIFRVIDKVDEKNESKKIERWQKIAKEAATQSGRQKIPYVEKAINLKNSIEKLSKYDIVIVPYECEKENYIKNVLRNMDENVKNIAIVVGPEGGFSDGDIEILSELTNMKKVSLGPRILRTETAGFITLAMAIYELDKL